MTKQKIALGTVQFGLDYGISNTTGKTPEQEVKKVLNYAWENGIALLDTAFAYGDSENVIGRNADHSFKIVSKFPSGTKANDLPGIFDKSLSNLHQDAVYGYIAHNAGDFIGNEELWQAALTLKETGRVQKIGYSLYTPEELDTLLAAGMIPDLVQLPYNLLDCKFDNHLEILKNYNVEVHVRSIFLQGLFFMESFPEKLKPLATVVGLVKTIAGQHSLTITQLLLNYALHNPCIDAVVMGVNNCSQLEENIAAIVDVFPFDSIKNEVKSIEIKDKHLLNPVNWK